MAAQARPERARRRLAQKVFSLAANDFCFFFGHAAKIQVGFDQAAHLAGAIHKRDVIRVTREGFDADRTRAGTEIEESHSFDSRRDDIKEGFPEAIRSWANL